MRKSKNRLTEAEAEARLDQWGLQAQAQWKKDAPKLYESLRKSGQLYKAVHAVQERAKRHFLTSYHKGMDPVEAHGMAQESLHRFDPENDPAREEPWEEEAAEDSAMQATKRLLEEPSQATPQGQFDFEEPSSIRSRRLVRDQTDEAFEVTLRLWANALVLAEDYGWAPLHLRTFYLVGPVSVTAEDASSMAAAWERLFEKTIKAPLDVYPVAIDMGCLYLLKDFVADGAFDIGSTQ